MYTIIEILVVLGVIMAIGMPLLELFILFGVGYVLKRIQILDLCKFIRDFLFVRAERKVFYAYLATMAPVIGFPWAFNIAFQYVTQECGIYALVEFANVNSIGISIAYLVSITLGYGIYACIIINRNKTTSLKEIVKSLSVINREFDFIPNQEWFNVMAKNAIEALGSRYDKEHNIRHPQMPLILSVMERRLSKLDSWMDDIEALIDNTYRVLGNCKKEKIKNAVKEDIRLFIEIVNADVWDEKAVEQSRAIITNVETTLTKWHNNLNRQEYDGVAYDWNHFEEQIIRFKKLIYSPWIECQYKQVMLIKGVGGMGKSHLLGNIVEERTSQNQPTILILGAKIYNGPDVWSQILALLDVKCKKQTFFNSLNVYAEKIGTRIQILIDAINEGAGKDYWADQISDFVSDISRYPNIGIILSVRTTNNSSRLDRYINDTSHATYEVLGFKDNLAQASEYMFDSFGLTTPSWSVIDGMFVNPMWLHMYCVSHEKLRAKSERENHWQIVENYIEGFENELAERFQYSKEIKLLQKVVMAIADKMISKKELILLPYQDAFDAIYESVSRNVDAASYFAELLQIGILRQGTHEDKTIVQFEYEMFGRFVIAYRLVTNYSEESWESIAWLYTQELVEVYPLIHNKELYTCFTDDATIRLYKNAFIETLQCRTSVTPTGIQMLNEIWQDKNYGVMFDVISQCAMNPLIKFNASQLYDELYEMPMMDRDALWTTEISRWSDSRTRLNDYASWAMNASKKTLAALDDKVAELLCETLIWSLCSTQGKLRDTATKGLVNVLHCRTALLASLVMKYNDINDLYVTERLWGVVFGCCTQNRELIYVEEMALLAQKYVFDKNPIVENLLITDYARLVIDYAIYLGSQIFLGYEKHMPPYNMYSTIPKFSDEYIIKTYDEPYSKHSDEKIGGSVMAILSSMAVENSRKGIGGYGDFGRYTFQYALSEFPEDPNALSNWGVNIIFEEIGYNPEQVKWFDSHTSCYASQDWERIGKKYQKLALYKIAAILTDFHTNDGLKKPDEEHCILSLRSIDPTVLNVDRSKVNRLRGMHHKQPPYSYEKMENKIWLQSPQNMPDVKQLVQQKRTEGVPLITLYAYNEYTLRKGILSEGELNREFWCFIQSCFVDKKCASKMVRIIHKKGMAGRGFTENQEIYNVYAGEWHWSEKYQEYVIGNEYEMKPLGISFERYENIRIRPTMIEYSHESHDDRSKDDGDIIYFPNSHIVDTLGLKLLDGRGIWMNAEGEAVIFDNAVTGGKHALMIRQDVLLEYLNKTGQVVIWPILIEKRIRNWHRDGGDRAYKYVQSGGYVMMNNKGRIKYKIRQYDREPSKAQLLMDKYISLIIKKMRVRMLDVCVRLHLVRLPKNDELTNEQIVEVLRKIEEGL
jgi:hypothetical protein